MRLIEKCTIPLIVLGMLGCLQGCTALTFPIRGTPAASLPWECRAERKRDLVPIDVTKLAQPQPDVYRLGPGDVIGVYLPNIIPYQSLDAPPAQIPIHYPLPGSDLQPSIGLPIVVMPSGKITLNGIEPLSVGGLTEEEAAEAIKAAYLDRKILRDDATPPTVNIIRPRTVFVTVVREDTGGDASEHSAMGASIQLSAYRNDVLNALMATGGLPGLRAKNEIRIYRNGGWRNGLIENSNIIVAAPEMNLQGQVPYSFDGPVDGPEVVIPLRIAAGTHLEINPNDVILGDGDIVYVSNRTTEVFYTSGLLPGGEHLLPRDYDIDIFEALSIAGYSYGNSSGGGLVPNSGIIPTQLFILRERTDGSEYAIEIDLASAISNDRERLLIQPGDKLILRYSPCEEVLNFGIFTFFTFGLRFFFQGGNN